jgi:hypothetical protein
VAQQESSDSSYGDAEHRDICCEGKCAEDAFGDVDGQVQDDNGGGRQVQYLCSFIGIDCGGLPLSCVSRPPGLADEYAENEYAGLPVNHYHIVLQRDS